jgi:sterol-4alpha-carboxylate 3-dehydrogenase (decarboxylating)
MALSAKAESERIALAASDESMPVCAIRPSVTFGPGDPNCFPTVYACIGRRETPFVIGSGDNLYDFTYVDNIAYAHVLALENLLTSRTAAGEAFFISNGEPIPFRDFCLAIWAGLGHRPPFEIHIPASVAWTAGYTLEWAAWLTGQPIGYCRGSVYDALRTRYLRIDKARKVLGYSPLVSVADGLRLTCQVSFFLFLFCRRRWRERRRWAGRCVSSIFVPQQ